MLNFALIDPLDHTNLERNASLAAAVASQKASPRTARNRRIGTLFLAVLAPQPYLATRVSLATTTSGAR
jgi:hypothetical protein